MPEAVSVRAAGDLPAIRALMERRVGVVRDAAGLEEAVAVLEAGAETCDAALVALLIARGALARRESRGAHWRSDFPHLAAAAHTEAALADPIAATPSAEEALTP